MDNHSDELQRLRLRASFAEGFMTLTKYLAGCAVTATTLVIGYEGGMAASLCVLVGLGYAIITGLDVWNSWL